MPLFHGGLCPEQLIINVKMQHHKTAKKNSLQNISNSTSCFQYYNEMIVAVSYYLSNRNIKIRINGGWNSKVYLMPALLHYKRLQESRFCNLEMSGTCSSACSIIPGTVI